MRRLERVQGKYMYIHCVLTTCLGSLNILPPHREKGLAHFRPFLVFFVFLFFFADLACHVNLKFGSRSHE